MSEEEFCHLHVHNEYSLLDGVGTAKDYAARAKELGMTHLALTNHGNVDGNIKFQKACLEAEIKPIHGVEAYIVKDPSLHEKGEKRCHINLLAENEEGWININRMLTYANLEGHFYRPRISPEILLEHRKGLVILGACASSFITEPWGLDLLAEIKKTNPTFLELMPLDWEPQRAFNQLCVKVAKDNDLELVATNDCHYVKEEDCELQEVLLAMQRKQKWSDPNRWKFEMDTLFLKSRVEMMKSFHKQNHVSKSIWLPAINNTMKVAELCGNFIIPKREVDLPLPRCVGDEDPDVFIERICRKALRERIKTDPKKAPKYMEYVHRYLEEKEVIFKQGFSIYFLIVWELIHWAKTHDIMVGPGRGSSGGSLICYLMDITEVDPIEYDLIFARFISPARIDLPDIDMDFEDTKRDAIRAHLEEEYGKDHVAGISTFGQMKGRGALRDVSRVFSVPIMDVNKAAASIVVRSGGDFRSDYTIEDAFMAFEDGKRFKAKYPRETRIAIALEGQVKSKGMHAAAMAISKENLKDGLRGNLQYAKGKVTVINWAKEDAESCGMMKLDVLGLNALTILNETRKLIKKNRGIDIIYREIPLDDPACFDEFTQGNNIGCFQVGSLGLRRLCAQLGIDTFMDIVHATSLHRPGTLRSGMVTEFIQRKKGQKAWSYKHPALEDITKNTLGVILYQEQVMRFMYDLGGLGWRTADTVRKVISKSQGVEQFLKFKDLFIQGCLDRGTLDAETAASLWDELASFGSYGFNMSHAVEYSMITYWDMWMKVHYPEEFLTCNLTYGPEDKKEEILEEVFRMGLKIALPKIGLSTASTWTVSGDTLFMPFCSIKGVGDKTAKVCEEYSKTKEAKEGFFSLQKGKKDPLGAKTRKILETIGAFDKEKELTQEDEEALSQYFSVPINRDPGRRYKKALERIKENYRIKQLGDIDWTKRPTKGEESFYFGRMTEIRFGYREKVTGLSTEDRMKAYGNVGEGGSVSGGVYGNLKDETDFVMVVFDQEIYNLKKDEIEHCSGEHLLIKTTRARNNVLCSEVWTGDDLLAGNLDRLDLRLIRRKTFEQDPLIAQCEKCPLRKECKRPVPPLAGKTNVMILGEAPTRDDDARGEPFVGRAGRVLIDALGMDKELFHWTNVVKCFPSETRTPNKRQISACSKLWLDKEIAEVDPFVILALGNTPLQYLKGVSSGITELNGKTEWVDKVNAWVCWCISPASVLYQEENKEFFKKGIENFKEKFYLLGKGRSYR